MPISPEGRTLRARVAALTRHHPDNPEVAAEGRRVLAIARVEARIAAAVQDAPPLPADLQRRLIELIRSVPVSTSDGEARS